MTMSTTTTAIALMGAMNQVRTCKIVWNHLSNQGQNVQSFIVPSAPVNDQGTYRALLAGSSACVNGKFYCANKGYTAQHLNATMVDDSFCGELVALLAHLASTFNPHDFSK